MQRHLGGVGELRVVHQRPRRDLPAEEPDATVAVRAVALAVVREGRREVEPEVARQPTSPTPPRGSRAGPAVVPVVLAALVAMAPAGPGAVGPGSRHAASPPVTRALRPPVSTRTPQGALACRLEPVLTRWLLHALRSLPRGPAARDGADVPRRSARLSRADLDPETPRHARRDSRSGRAPARRYIYRAAGEDERARAPPGKRKRTRGPRDTASADQRPADG